MNVQKLIDKVSDENIEKSLYKESSDGEVTIFKLPNETYAVPILDLFDSVNSEDFVHVRALKCSLEICARKTKSKKHTLVEKGVPICPHSMLGEKKCLNDLLLSLRFKYSAQLSLCSDLFG